MTAAAEPTGAPPALAAPADAAATLSGGGLVSPGTSAGRLGPTTHVVAALTVLLAGLFLDETPAPLTVVVGGVCLVGVAVARRAPRSRG